MHEISGLCCNTYSGDKNPALVGPNSSAGFLDAGTQHLGLTLLAHRGMFLESITLAFFLGRTFHEWSTAEAVIDIQSSW
jgi:hypothetical protein